MPSPPLLRSPPHWTPAESPMSPTPPIVAMPPSPAPPTASCTLAALEAATVTLWWSPHPIPSEPHPVSSKARPSPPPPYGLPPCMWPTTSPVLQPTHGPTPALLQCKRHTNSE
ncbi:hypothetical protein C0989_001888 [Termitomyces sp. Mn162]|nr:hypothetical protein C0989_001888 [Termitomyces sp. Mn162]